MRYAQIKNDKIINIIELEDESLADLFSEGFDYFISMGCTVNCPKIGYNYNPENEEFSIPVKVESERDIKRKQDRLEFEEFKTWKASQSK